MIEHILNYFIMIAKQENLSAEKRVEILIESFENLIEDSRKVKENGTI